MALEHAHLRDHNDRAVEALEVFLRDPGRVGDDEAGGGINIDSDEAGTGK